MFVGDACWSPSISQSLLVVHCLRVCRDAFTLHSLAEEIERTQKNLLSFFLFLTFFGLFFSILGMNLFGCKFCDKDDKGNDIFCDRKNFDSLLWATVTVFQVRYSGLCFRHQIIRNAHHYYNYLSRGAFKLNFGVWHHVPKIYNQTKLDLVVLLNCYFISLTFGHF